MNVLELHPDHLVDALREGRLTTADRTRLEAHCARCSACLFELRWIEQSRVSSLPSAADRACGEAALAAVLQRSGPRSGRAVRTLGWPVQLGIGAFLLVCGVSFALLWGDRGQRSLAAMPQARTPEAVAPVMCVPEAHVEHVSSKESQTSPSAATLPSANQLLASARLAYTRGQVDRAERLYRQVIGRYPSASAAGAAQIALGRLLYVEKSQPSAALSELEDYLRRRPSGALAEEALFFRALSLDRLGKSQQAEETLQKLLRLYPDTVYEASARVRLAR